MKIVKSLLRGLFWVLIIALLLAPVGLIWKISNQEIARYQMPDPPKFVQTAYGTIVQATRMDVEELVTVSGTFIAKSTVYQELDVESPGNIRWTAKAGQEVQEGQVLGTLGDKEVVCQYNGKLMAINSYGTEPYLEIQLLSPLTMECHVSRSTLRTMQRAKELTTKDGTPVTIDYVSNIPDAAGNLRVLLSIDTDYYYYGETVTDLQLHTGNKYTQALVLPVSALYQKNAGEDQPWYVYKVKADGEAVGEQEVTVGYNNGSVACVSGIQAGEYFDTGYGAIKGES